MAKYYLVADLLLPALKTEASIYFGSKMSIKDKEIEYKKYAKSSLPNFKKFQPPKNYRFLKLSEKDEIKVVYFEFDIGCFLIKTNNKKSAYKILDIIYGFHALYREHVPNTDAIIYKLQEIKKIPRYTWTIKNVKEALDKNVHYNYGDAELCAMQSGLKVDNYTHENLKMFLKFLYNNNDVRETLNHLLKSIQIFGGIPNGSYYQFHYRPDKESESRLEKEKKSLENKTTYEISFVAAFKGIERFFKVNDINTKNITKIFNNIKYKNIKRNSTYTRYFEIFSGKDEKIKYSDLIANFLILRNVAGAHGNKKIPENFMITDESCLEIQCFLTTLINSAFDEFKKNK